MPRTKMLLVFCLSGISSCSTFRLAPGADQVRVTNQAADVRECTPVGNIKIPDDQIALFSNQLNLARNQAIGFGGNAAFVTEGTLRNPTAGIAYRCPKAGA